MKELSVTFGPGEALSAVITEPETPSPRNALLLVSAGLLPKHGPFRLYAELGRRLAREGFVCLRFDLGGIGDSRICSPALPLKERTGLEIRAAVDYLSNRYCIQRLALGGLCSGAEDAYRYAEQDARIGRVLMLDPFAYRTPGWAWRHFLMRAKRWGFRVRGIYSPYASNSERPLVDYKYMSREESTRILKAMLAREARLHFIYTGGMLETFNHKAQLQAMFPGIVLKGKVTVDHFPDLEHTQVLQEDRNRLVEAMVRRLVATTA